VKPTIHYAFDLIEACSTPCLSDAAMARIRTRADAITDWSAVAELAAFYRAAPILHARLQSSAVRGVPPEILAGLHKSHLANTVRTARLAHTLGELCAALADAGIPVLSFKGPLLAQQAYDDPSLRQFDDLDLMVHQPDLQRAKHVIESMDYAEVLGLPSRIETSPFRPSKPYTLRHRDGSHDIDLSCHLLHDYFSFRFAPDLLWGEPHTATVDGHVVHTIPPEALFLYLCLHGAKHLWSRPAWIADVAGLLCRQSSGIDWDVVWEMARAGDGIRMLNMGVALAAAAYDAPVPPALQKSLGADPVGEALCAEIERRRHERAGQPETDDLERLRIHLRLRRRLRSRLRYLIVRGATPSYNDWRMLELPGGMFPLYYPLRFLRLGGRAARGVVSHVARRIAGLR